MMRRYLGLAMIAGALAFGLPQAQAQTAPVNANAVQPAFAGGNKNLVRFTGTFAFSFDGGSAVTNNENSKSSRISGNGVFVVDGKGNVVGGKVYCNQIDSYSGGTNKGFEWVGTIIGGKYTVNASGIGGMYWQFRNFTADAPISVSVNFCDSHEAAIEFTFALLQGENQLLFASAAYNGDSTATSPFYPLAIPEGQYKILTGNAYRTSNAVKLVGAN